MMEVGGTTSSMMKVRGATKSNPRNYVYKVIFIFVIIDMFMMRLKLLHRIDGCVWSYQSYDDGGG